MKASRLVLAPALLAAILIPASALSEPGSPADPAVDPATGALIEPIEALPPEPATIDVLDQSPDGEVVAVDGEGNVWKVIGESGGLSSADGQTVLFELSIDSAEYASTCPGREGETITATGEFLVLHVTATLSAEITAIATGEDDVFMPVIPDLFVARDPSGTPAPASEAAWGCYGPELILPFVEPGTTHAGLIVLDVPARGGTVTYDPDGSGGWTWQLP